MIQTKQELINLLPTIYQNLNTPLFLISPDLKKIRNKLFSTNFQFYNYETA